MEIKIFKKQSQFDSFVKSLSQDDFYKLLSSEKKLFSTINKVLVFNKEDVEKYLIEKFHQILELLAVKDFQEKIYLNDNNFYLKITCENQDTLLLKKYGYVISSIQNLLITYLYSKFSKWYKVVINVNNHLHNQKYFLKKQIYFAIKNIKEKGKHFHFKPMPNDQRKLVHQMVKEIDGFASFSQGNGFLRHIVIKSIKVEKTDNN